MKKSTLFSALLSMVTFILIGCADNHENMSDSPGKDVTILASHSQILPPLHSRTIIGGVQEDGALVMKWNVSDELGIFTENGDNLRFVSQNTSPSPTASFTPAQGVTLLSDPQVGYYPYESGNTNRNAIPASIPQVQDYADESSIAQYDLKGANVVKQPNGSFLLQMQQMTSLIRFEVSVNELKSEIEKIGAQTELTQVDMNAQHIQSIEISTDDNVRLTGNYTYNLTNLDAGLNHVGTDETDGSLKVNLTTKPLLTLTENLVFYAVVAPGKHLNQILSCKVLCEHVSLQFSAKIGCDFAAGSYYTLALNSATIAKAIDGTVGVVVTPDPDAPVKPVYPGQDEETANCYMINTTGAHEFWGTQIGNGAKGIIPGAGFHTDDPYINPKSAKLLWQDVQNFVSDVTFNPKDGKVHYTANKTSGNALIAVYDGPNGTGNVLWSWHVWGTGDQPVAEEYTNMANAKFMVMDRPLGAHSKTSTTATLYQWGRKDPIPNSSVYFKTEGDNSPAINIEESYPINKKNSTHTLLETIQEPDKIMYCLNPQDGMAQGSYLVPANTLLWGDGNELSQFDLRPDQLADPRADNKWLYQKTIYDPSPVGYRVANKFTFTAFLNVSDGTTAGKAGLSGLPGLPRYVNYVEPLPDGTREHSAWIFKRYPEDKVGAYWAMTGRRNAGSGTLLEYANTGKGPNSVGLLCWVWTSGQGSAKDDGSIFRSDGCKKNKYNKQQIDWGQITVVDWAAQRNLHAVRCVVDNPNLVVNN